MAGPHARRPEGPVFLDPSGRRSTAVRVVGWLVAAAVTGYLLLVAVALVGPPGLSRVTVPGIGPVLPGPGAAPIDGGQSSPEPPGTVLERSPSPSGSPSPSPRPSRTTAPPSAPGTGSPSAAPGATRLPVRGPSPATSAPATTTTSASPTPRRTGRPTAQPTREAPPGASRRPSRSPG